MKVSASVRNSLLYKLARGAQTNEGPFQTKGNVHCLVDHYGKKIKNIYSYRKAKQAKSHFLPGKHLQ